MPYRRCFVGAWLAAGEGLRGRHGSRPRRGGRLVEGEVLVNGDKLEHLPTGSLEFLPPALAVANQQQGRLRIVGITAPVRSPQYPQVPTLAEQPGLGGFEASTWFALYAPAGLPADITARLNQETNAVLQTQDLRDKFTLLALTPLGGSAAGLTQTMLEEQAKWGRVITTRKIPPLD